jgi:hypothetical protein
LEKDGDDRIRAARQHSPGDEFGGGFDVEILFGRERHQLASFVRIPPGRAAGQAINPWGLLPGITSRAENVGATSE